MPTRWLDNIRNRVLPNEAARQRWVREKLLALPAGLKLLDAGAGQQPYRSACAHLEYYAQDFGEYSPEGGGGLQVEGWDYGHLDYQGDIWKIDEADATFDVILCTEVFEHIPYPNETFAEFARLLKPGGQLLLTVPYACLPHMQPHFYYSGFSREYLQRLLAHHGFEIRELSVNGSFFKVLVQENLRGGRLIANPAARWLYYVVMSLPLLLQRLLAEIVPDQQLVFGHHVVAVKTQDQDSPTPRPSPARRSSRSKP